MEVLWFAHITHPVRVCVSHVMAVDQILLLCESLAMQDYNEAWYSLEDQIQT